ncbi:MAG: nucleotidyltransferase family protein [Clostridia bacterium]|nr:nucleotidyltransferase family protein [Clostridia bacterium]
MRQKEKELFKSLCSFKEMDFDESLLDAATPTVLGHLFFNRMQAVAYGILKKHGLLGKVNREFRNSLKGASMQSIEKNNSFFQCVEFVEKALSSCECKYAMLKGAYLCKAYPEGYRTSNDIDLLVHPKDVTEVGNALLVAGFKQGNVRNGKFEAATRKEIIESKMMRGETVPYIKETNLPGMQFLEVDINFSLDYKPGDTDLLEEMMNNTLFVKLGDFRVRTLRADDFFVHLCSHLYKEATTLPWVEMMRDMTLYKYCDIYMLLNDADEKYVDSIFDRAEKLSMEKVCAFAVLHTAELFNFRNQYAIEVATKALGYDLDFVHRIISPKDKKELVFTERNILERFFADNRKALLEEVNHSEDSKYET